MGIRRWWMWMARSTVLRYLALWGLFCFGIGCLWLLVILLIHTWGLGGTILAVIVLYPITWLSYTLYSVLLDGCRSFSPLMVFDDGIMLQTTLSERRKGLSSLIRPNEIESVRLVRRRALWGRMVRSSGSRNHLIDGHDPNELVIALTTGPVRRTGKRKPATIRAVADIIEKEWGVAVVDDEGDRQAM